MGSQRYAVVYNHGGKFVRNPHLSYEGGEETVFYEDPDEWGYFEVINRLKELKYPTVDKIFYKIGDGQGRQFEFGLKLLFDDKGAMEIMSIAQRKGEVNLYVEHTISIPEILLEPPLLPGVPSVREHGEGADVTGASEVPVEAANVDGVIDGAGNTNAATIDRPTPEIPTQDFMDWSYEVGVDGPPLGPKHLFKNGKTEAV